MNRRGFIGALLGTAAATALPSEIWPFRKIFLPNFWAGTSVVRPDLTGLAVNYGRTATGWGLGLSRSPYPGRLTAAAVEAVQLESIAREIPDLIQRQEAIYQLFKRGAMTVTIEGFSMIDRNGTTLYDREGKRIERMRIPVRPMAQASDLLHAPATPENVMEFIDELDKHLP